MRYSNTRKRKRLRDRRAMGRPYLRSQEKREVTSKPEKKECLHCTRTPELAIEANRQRRRKERRRTRNIMARAAEYESRRALRPRLGACERGVP